MPTDLPLAWYDVAMTHYLSDHHYAVDNLYWTSASAEEPAAGAAQSLDAAPSGALPLAELRHALPRQDMTIASEADIYLALYGSLEGSGRRGEVPAPTGRGPMAAMSSGGRHPARRREPRCASGAASGHGQARPGARRRPDPDGLFNSWMGRI